MTVPVKSFGNFASFGGAPLQPCKECGADPVGGAAWVTSEGPRIAFLCKRDARAFLRRTGVEVFGLGPTCQFPKMETGGVCGARATHLCAIHLVGSAQNQTRTMSACSEHMAVLEPEPSASTTE